MSEVIEQSEFSKEDSDGSNSESLLDVRGLEKHYPIKSGFLQQETGFVRAVDGIDLSIDRGETLGLIGESGCGKSTTATSLLRIEEPTGGSVQFDGLEVTDLGESELRSFRRRAAMVFQDPNGSFDPRISIGESVGEPLRIHGMSDESERREIVGDLLSRVGLGEETRERYPHELSGGQKQRASLARALALNPDLLVLDEPTSALDVSVQAEILHLLDDLRREFDLAMLVITHDMGVVRAICDRVAVMYLGEIVERGNTSNVFENPLHPYTESLVAAVPSPELDAPTRELELTGEVPDASNPPSGCRFHTRCPEVIPPEGFEWNPGVFRRLMNFIVAVRGGNLDIQELRERMDGHEIAPLREEIRKEYDLPDELTDPDAEEVLSEAISLAARQEFGEATELLRDEFESVCERENPSLSRGSRDGETAAGQTAACHLVE